MSQGPPCKKNWSAGNKRDPLFHKNVHFASILIILTTKLTTNKEKPLAKRTSKGYSRHIFLMHFYRRIELNLLTEQRSDDQGGARQQFKGKKKQYNT